MVGTGAAREATHTSPAAGAKDTEGNSQTQGSQKGTGVPQVETIGRFPLCA